MEISSDPLELTYKRIVPSEIKSDGISLLFLHDALGSIPQWRSFPQKLCAKLALQGIVYEREGYGMSSPPPKKRSASYLHDYALIELPKFIEQSLPAGERIILVGHSDGGTIAMLYARKYPERVLGIVSIAAHVINEAETIWGVIDTVTAYEQGKLDGLRKFHGDNTESVFYAWADIWRSPSFKAWDISKEIGGAFPALILQGTDDAYGTLRQLELINEAFANGTTRILSDCGHHPHLQQEELVIDEIQSWFTSLAV